jgi:anti-sigma regulatory factor (Ser/Thr protein kinase)
MDVSAAGYPTRVIAIEESSQVGQARREALGLAAAAGFEEVDAGRVALAATELATNILKHGGGGQMRLTLVRGRDGYGVELCAMDQGSGFDLVRCLPDGYSTGGSQGLGLGAISRQAAVLDTWSDPRGTLVLARIYAERAVRDMDLPYGAQCVAMRHEPSCGDAWQLNLKDGQLALAVIDGLGHGVLATEAAQAGAAAMASSQQSGAAELITCMHRGMAGTRGGAAAVAAVDLRQGRLDFAGIGNISATLCDIDTTRGLPSLPGIVGVQFRKAQAFMAETTASMLLIMHSDGLQSRWNLRDYPGLFQRHPALIAAILHRDFDRGRDDACVVVVRLGGFE